MATNFHSTTLQREALRQQPLIVLAKEANLPGVDALVEAVKGKPSGMLFAITQAIEKSETLDTPSPEIRSVLLRILRKLRHLKELGLVASLVEMIERAEADASSFLAHLDLESGTTNSFFDELLAATLSDVGRTTRSNLRAIDSYSLDFQANAAEVEAREVLRIELAASFVPALVPHVVSNVLRFLKEYQPFRGGARVRVIRAEPSYSADSNAVRSRMLLLVEVSGLAQVRPVCLKLVEDFYNLSGSADAFSNQARSTFAMYEMDLLNPSVFLSLVLLRRSSPLLSTSSADPLLQHRALEWRAQLQRVAPGMSDEEVAAEIERLWFEQILREDLSFALEFSREDIRVVCVASCRCRAVVELVSRAKGIARDTLLSRARQLQDLVCKGESVFAGGVPLPAFEYLRSVDISSGYCPPNVPGQWMQVTIYCSSSGVDTLPERRALSTLVVPALQRVLRQHRILLTAVDLSLNGPAQGTRAVASLPQRLNAMSACGLQYAGSQLRIPFFLGVLAGEGGSLGEHRVVVARDTIPGAIVPGNGDNGAGNTIRVRAWAGDTSETVGHARPAGRGRLSMSATVHLGAGEYTGAELAAHLQHQLTHGTWSDDKTFQPVAPGLGKRNPRGHGLPMEWVCGIDDAGYLYVSSVSYTFFRFEFVFQGETLPDFLGLQVDEEYLVQSSEVVRQRPEETEGYEFRTQHVEEFDDQVSASSGAATSMSSVFVSTLRASVPVNPSEERLQCFKDHAFVMEHPWAQMSDSALELGKACFLQPLSGESVVLIRDSSWMRDKSLGTACTSGELPHSAVRALGFSAHGQVEADPLDGPLVEMALSLADAPFNVPLTTYRSSFRQFRRNVDSYLDRFEALLEEVAAMRRDKGLVKKGSSSRFGADMREQIMNVGADSTGNAAQVQVQVLDGCGLTTDDLYQLKVECYGWWRLLREDYSWYDKAGRCPHGMPIERCAETLCERLYAAALNPELKQYHETLSKSREAAGLPQDSSALWHPAPSMAGVDMDVQDFAKAALQHIYATVLAHAPAAPVPPQGVNAPPVRLVNPVDAQEREEAAQRRRERRHDPAAAVKLPIGNSCRPFHSHLDLRASQRGMQLRLAKGFLMPAGGSRNKAFYELERNSTGPPSSLPPLVVLRGPPGSGKTRMIARFSTHSARCNAQRALVRHMTSSKFASHYSSALQPFDTFTPVSPHVPSNDAAKNRSDEGSGLVQAVLFRNPSQPLASVLDYFTDEISLQSTGSLVEDEESRGHGHGGESERTCSSGQWVNNLMNTSFADLTGEAERRFLRQCALALSVGNSILLLCDGLEDEQWAAFGELVLLIHTQVASQLQSLRFNGHEGEAPSIQCILSVTNLPGPFGRPAGFGRVDADDDQSMVPWGKGGRRPAQGQGLKEGKRGVRGAAREVELTDLTKEEKLAIALQVFEEMNLGLPLRHAAESDDGQPHVSREGLAAAIALKSEAYLPLYVVTAAAQVAQFETSHMRHRQMDSFGEVQRAGAADEFAQSLPGSLSALWTAFLLPRLENAVDFLTVQWVMIHLLNHPGGLSRQDLQVTNRVKGSVKTQRVALTLTRPLCIILNYFAGHGACHARWRAATRGAPRSR